MAYFVVKHAVVLLRQGYLEQLQILGRKYCIMHSFIGLFICLSTLFINLTLYQDLIVPPNIVASSKLKSLKEDLDKCPKSLVVLQSSGRCQTCFGYVNWVNPCELIYFKKHCHPSRVIQFLKFGCFTFMHDSNIARAGSREN